MARRDTLLPNAGIVARREFRERVRSPLYVASTIVLMILALGVSLTPTIVRFVDRQTVTRIAIVAEDVSLGERAVGLLDGLLNRPPEGVDDEVWSEPFGLELAASRDDAESRLARGRIAGVLVVQRLETGQIDAVYRAQGLPDATRSQFIQVAIFGLGVLDWSANLPPGSGQNQFRTPSFNIESTSAPTVDGRPISPQEIASRTFLGTVFIVLMFISILIYGMWVATGVATEKSSRVMELMISAASPRQLIIGKVLGIGGAGLTQYIAIAIPALLVLVFQDRIAELILGPGGAEGAPVGGLTLGLLLGYGTLFLLGFTLYAFVYAAVGSFVSRPDDLQTLSLPLSLLAMSGYLASLPILIGGGGALSTLASFIPPFSPFAMLARIMVGRVETWEIALAVVLLLLATSVVAVVAIRMYSAGVLLYGQRPGLRAFFAAARRAG